MSEQFIAYIYDDAVAIEAPATEHAAPQTQASTETTMPPGGRKAEITDPTFVGPVAVIGALAAYAAWATRPRSSR